ncbi:hypothetical protein MTO96_012046 [Rhipicephalus appendiculatus]
MTTSRKRAPLGSPGRIRRHTRTNLRESLEGEKERKNTNARGEGPRCLSLGGVHRPANGDSSLSSNSAVTRPRVSKVTTTRRRSPGDFYTTRKKEHIGTHPKTSFFLIGSRADVSSRSTVRWHWAVKIDACEARSHDDAPKSCTRLDFTASFLEKPRLRRSSRRQRPSSSRN